MAHVAFDTLKFVEKLTAAGISSAQAKAIVEAQNNAFDEALGNTLVIKTDLIQVENNLKQELAILKGELQLLKWMLGFLLAGVASLIIKAFF